MGAFCVAFALFGGMILIALCGMGVEWYCQREEEMAYSKENLRPQAVTESYSKAENSCQSGGFVKYRCSADKKRGKSVGKIDQLRSE